MKNIKSYSLILPGLFLTGNMLYANFGDALVGGVVGGAVGSIITNEVYHSNDDRGTHSTHRTHHHTTHKSKKRSHRKHIATPRMTDEKRIQKALSSLGFYHGKIDGEVNSYETRSAIKEMNIAYEISQSASLRPEEKDSLIYLGTLLEFDRYLIAHGADSKTKGRKIQTALKVLGYYHDRIDGLVGRGTRSAIAQYKDENGMSPTGYLDFEEEYQLVDRAKEKNDKNIDDVIQSIKVLGGKQSQAKTSHVIELRAPEQKPASIELQPQKKETMKGGWE